MKPHTHPCCDCHDGVAICDGEWEQDYDGSGPTCRFYTAVHYAMRCEDCEERLQQTIRDEVRAENPR